jgi:hypothetical protein
MRPKEITLTQAAIRMSASYNQTLRRVLLGEIRGVQRNGRWYVDRDDLERFVARSNAPPTPRSSTD